jgi:hypothetical protein
VSAHVAIPPGIVVFVDGAIDSVMWFEGTNSRQLHVDGGAGAWTLVIAEPEFVSASLATIPGSRNLKRLMIKLRDHCVVIDPGHRDGP